MLRQAKAKTNGNDFRGDLTAREKIKLESADFPLALLSAVPPLSRLVIDYREFLHEILFSVAIARLSIETKAEQ